MVLQPCIIVQWEEWFQSAQGFQVCKSPPRSTSGPGKAEFMKS